jgi:hypothetical protein
MRTLIALLAASTASCAPIVVQGMAGNCSRYVPPSMWAPVPPAELPEAVELADGHDDAAPWQKGFLEQSGQLEKANSKPADIKHIVTTCEADQAASLKRDTRRSFLGVHF